MGKSLLIAVNVLITITVTYSRNTPPVDACGFLQKSGLIHRFPEGKPLYGVQVIDKEVYVIRDLTPYIEVYDSDTFQSKRNISIKHIQRPYNLVQSGHNSSETSLFINDWSNEADMTVVKVPSGTVTKWSSKDYLKPFGLTGSSFYTGENILGTAFMRQRVVELTPDGKLVSEVIFRNISNPRHTVKMAADRYVVSHGYVSPSDLYQVCLVDGNGETIKCYGGLRGSGVGQLNIPVRLELNEKNCILVADIRNKRVVVLDQNLNHVRNLITEDLEGPQRLFLDQKQGLLYVADNTNQGTGRVKVFKI